MHRQNLYGVPETDHTIHHQAHSNDPYYYCPTTDEHYRAEGDINCVGCKARLARLLQPGIHKGIDGKDYYLPYAIRAQ